MTLSVLMAALLFVIPKTPPDSALQGWEKQGLVPLPYAKVGQRLSADLATDGWRLVRTEHLGAGVHRQEIRKYANAAGATVVFRLWRVDTSMTGYSYRRDRQAVRDSKSGISRVVGVLDFSLIGILSRIATALAKAKIGILRFQLSIRTMC